MRTEGRPCRWRPAAGDSQTRRNTRSGSRGTGTPGVPAHDDSSFRAAPRRVGAGSEALGWDTHSVHLQGQRPPPAGPWPRLLEGHVRGPRRLLRRGLRRRRRSVRNRRQGLVQDPLHPRRGGPTGRRSPDASLRRLSRRGTEFADGSVPPAGRPRRGGRRLRPRSRARVTHSASSIRSRTSPASVPTAGGRSASTATPGT